MEPYETAPSCSNPISTTRPCTPTNNDHSDAATVQPELLKKYGLVINTTYQIIICLECAGIIDPNRVRAHLVKHHKLLHAPTDLQHVFSRDVLCHHPDLTYQPPHPTTPVTPVFGLKSPVRGYLQCSSCNKCYGDRKSFRQHVCDDPVGRKNVSCAVQRFLDNTSWSWFPVLINEPQTIKKTNHWSAYAAACAAQMSAATNMSQAVPQNYRVLHQFLHKERWIQQIAGLAHDDLIPLAVYSAKDPRFGTIHRHIHAFLAKIQAEIGSHYLRRLIGTRPGAEHSISYQRHHSDVGYETHEKYSRVFAGVLMLCIRAVLQELQAYQFSIPQDMQKATLEFIDVLDPPSPAELEAEDGSGEYIPHAGEELLTDYEWIDVVPSDEHDESDEDRLEQAALSPYKTSGLGPPPKTSEAVQAKLRVLLTIIFTQIPTDVARGTFHSPIMHYLLLSSLRPGTEWVPASIITQRIAASLFVGRSTMAVALLQEMARDKTLTLHTYVPFILIFRLN